MRPATKAIVSAMVLQNRRSPHDKTTIHVPLRAADARRSVNNILQWNTYLPANCVRTMVRMGWDYTT
jgi:hypothetical protein